MFLAIFVAVFYKSILGSIGLGGIVGMLCPSDQEKEVRKCVEPVIELVNKSSNLFGNVTETEEAMKTACP